MQSEPITSLLLDWQAGNENAREQLIELIYPMLKSIASNQLRSSPAELTMQTTELANEAYLKLTEQQRMVWQSRAHFFAIAARAIRRIIVDSVRRRLADKRGGHVEKIPFDEDLVAPAPGSYPNWIMLDAALNELEDINKAAAQVVELRYVVGMTIEETAESTGRGYATVVRNWRFARAFLRDRLGEYQRNPES